MKKLLLTIGLAAVMTGGVHAQGSFDFANGGVGVNAPITYNGTPIPDDTTYTVSYYWSTSGARDPAPINGNYGLLTSRTLGAQSVNPSVAPGYFFGNTTSIAGQTGTVFIQPVVWLTSSGSLANAIANNGRWTAFNPVSVTLATGVTPPPLLVGLLPLEIVIVPEPATIALGGLGVAGLLLFRRRK